MNKEAKYYSEYYKKTLNNPVPPVIALDFNAIIHFSVLCIYPLKFCTKYPEYVLQWPPSPCPPPPKKKFKIVKCKLVDEMRSGVHVDMQSQYSFHS